MRERTGPIPVVIVPGIGGSGPGHWQSLWQPGLPEAVRFAPASWDRPDAADWSRALRTAIAACSAPPVLLAHSLGCLAAAQVARHQPEAVAGAFLVAPPDPEGADFPAHAASFRPLDQQPIGVPAVLVSSRDDPSGSPAFCAGLARAWGTTPVDAGAVGHINVDSGVGAWPEGRAVFEGFVAELGSAAPER